MHIFIDESGTFALSERSPSISAVGSLILPSKHIAGLEKLYTRLRRTLPKEAGQVKGRMLSEAEVVKVVDVVRKVGGIFEVVIVDMGMHSQAELHDHRAGQASAITAHLTDAHHPNLKEAVWQLRRELESMPLQLYVQAVAMETLVYHTINHAQTYFAFHSPVELRSYHWTIDAKHNGDDLSPWERWWSKAVLPMLESHTFREPFMWVEGGDYSGLRRFETTVGEWKSQFLPKGEKKKAHFDLRLLMEEDFRFSAQSETGLEIVDVLVNAMRRSLAGNFSRNGWLTLPNVMIHRVPQCFNFISLSKNDPTHPLPYAVVLRDFQLGGRTMLTNYRGEG